MALNIRIPIKNFLEKFVNNPIQLGLYPEFNIESEKINPNYLSFKEIDFLKNKINFFNKYKKSIRNKYSYKYCDICIEIDELEDEIEAINLELL